MIVCRMRDGDMYLERRDSKHQCSYFAPQLLIVGSISRTSLIVRSEWLANDITCDFNRSQLSDFGKVTQMLYYLKRCIRKQGSRNAEDAMMDITRFDTCSDVREGQAEPEVSTRLRARLPHPSSTSSSPPSGPDAAMQLRALCYPKPFFFHIRE